MQDLWSYDFYPEVIGASKAFKKKSPTVKFEFVNGTRSRWGQKEGAGRLVKGPLRLSRRQMMMSLNQGGADGEKWTVPGPLGSEIRRGWRRKNNHTS